MTRLDDYRFALLATFPDVTDAELAAALEKGGSDFVSFIIDHGLGPLWHERTERDEFRKSRLSAEALYAAQEHALGEIDAAMNSADIEYAVFKGAATRLLLHENPAIRACYDIDLLVRPEDRVRAASAIAEVGFTANPDVLIISHELLLSRGGVDIDLHWGLLREGRLQRDLTADMLDRRRESEIWMLSAEDALFVLLVHPAFSKHLAGWGMGLHRVVDITTWLRTQSFDWEAVRAQLERNGVQAAAWATLHWLNLLTCRSGASPRFLVELEKMMSDLRPGRLRVKWLDWWLRNDLSARLSTVHWSRLVGLSLLLHDTAGDAARAVAGRHRARRRRAADLAVFRDLVEPGDL